MIGDQRVLVVEDSATSRKIVTRYLEDLGLQVESTTNGLDAINMLRRAAPTERPFTIVVTDLVLPGLDGYGLIELMRREPNLANIRLILLTAFDEQGRDAEARDHGFDAYLTKPVDRAALQHAVLTPRAAGSSPQPAAPPPTEEARPARVLVAEDSPVSQKLIVLQLNKLGYSADVVADGRAALRAIEQGPYELVLMDCQMPELDGLAATTEVRRIERARTTNGSGPHLPIIALTASLTEEDRANCLAAGMDDCLAKPIGMHALQTVIEHWLRPQQSVPVNYAMLNMLRKLEAADAPDLLDQLIDVYLQETPATLSALQTAISAADAPALRQLAHRLKGSSLNFGAKEVASICQEMEQLGKAGTVQGADVLYARLGDAYEHVRAALIREQKVGR